MLAVVVVEITMMEVQALEVLEEVEMVGILLEELLLLFLLLVELQI